MGPFFSNRAAPPRPAKTPERIVISGLGVVIPQGGFTLAAALALRCRKSTWCAHETVLVADDPHGVILRGATVSRVSSELLSPELDGVERAAGLLLPALKECLAGLTPVELRILECRVENFVESERDELYRLLQGAFPLISLVPVQKGDVRPNLGRCAFFEGVAKAAVELQAGTTQRILVGCVDSLCALSWLMAVRDDGVLKDALTPEGVIAGEAAGAVLLERESTARRRNAPVLGVLSSWGRGTESNGWSGPAPATGRGLTEAFAEALSALGDDWHSVTTVVADLNGERHRALDWAYAEGRVFSEKEPELRHPAFLTGDCGAATGVVLLADAIGRSVFHPRFRGRVALATSDEGGARRVICLEGGDRLDRRELMEEIRRRMQETQR